MATGDQSGTWGDTTNTNLGTLLEQAITGYLSVAQGDVANLTLTTVNGGTDQARNAVVRITGALTATRNVVIQTANKLYTIANDTTGGFSIVVKTSAGTGVSVPPGAMVDVYSDGTNAVQAANYWTGATGGIAYLDAGAAVGPNFDLFRDSTSPAISDILGRVTFNGRDNAANKQEYASIETVVVSPTSTSEAGALDIYVVKAGARTKMASLTPAGTAFTGAAGYSFDAPMAISNSASGPALVVTSTDAGASAGPTFDLYRNSATPAASDAIGSLLFSGRDSAGNKQTYAQITTVIVDPVSGSEDSFVNHSIIVAGADQDQLYLGLTGAGGGDTNAVGLPRGQLAFPPTQNPSSNANILDDYEEGTWTPALQLGGASVGMTGTYSGTYTKIGRLVKVYGVISLSAKGSSTGSAIITNLPFTASASNAGALLLDFTSGWTGLTGVLGGFIGANQSAITMLQSSLTGLDSNVTDVAVTNTTYIDFSVVYEA